MDIERNILYFIRDGKPSKLKRDILQQSITNGGVNLANISHILNASKTSWIKRLLDENVVESICQPISSAPWRQSYLRR